MFCILTEQPDSSFPRQRLLRCGKFVVLIVPLIVLLFVATSAVALAEAPQRHRPLQYEPVTVQRPDAPQSHVAAYPDPQADPPASRSSGVGTSRVPEELLNASLPEPVGRITEPGIRKWLDEFNQKIAAAKSGETVNPSDNAPGVPATDGPGNTLPNAGIKPVRDIKQLDDKWLAYEEGNISPIPVIKSGDDFYAIDNDGQIRFKVIKIDEPSVIDDEQAKEDVKTTLADDQTRNALLLIVTTIAVLAAFGIGILAFDYKQRWEQEIVSQNSRLLGNTASLGVAAHGTFAERDSLEPETLRFSLHDYGSPDDAFDHSFRTIA